MVASNFTLIKGKDIQSFKLGDTAWTTADFASTSLALDTTFDTNNASPLIDLVGNLDSNSPVESAAWAKEISITGNERSTEDEDYLGTDTTGAQNKEVIGGSVSKMRVEVTMSYRNNVPLSVFNSTTKCAIIEVANGESATTGNINFAFNNITMVKVGDIKQGPNGTMEQMFAFECAGGLTGAPIAVTQTTASETWSRVAGGGYAEEVQLT